MGCCSRCPQDSQQQQKQQARLCSHGSVMMSANLLGLFGRMEPRAGKKRQLKTKQAPVQPVHRAPLPCRPGSHNSCHCA